MEINHADLTVPFRPTKQLLPQSQNAYLKILYIVSVCNVQTKVPMTSHVYLFLAATEILIDLTVSETTPRIKVVVNEMRSQGLKLAHVETTRANDRHAPSR